jgi:hypothetical protein
VTIGANDAETNEHITAQLVGNIQFVINALAE